MIETKLLHSFLAIAREQSFTKAALALNISQPALSKQLMELERQLGKQLFYRSSKSLTLTKEGIYLQSRAAEILSLLQQTESTFHAGEKLEGGEIRIGCSEGFLPSYAADCFRRLHERYPNVRLHVHNESHHVLMEHMEKGLLDMAFLYAPTIHTGYNHYPMPEEQAWGLLMPKTDPMAEKEFVTEETLKQVPLIYSDRIFHSVHHPNNFSLATEELNIVAVFTFFEEAARMAAMGLGYAFILEGTYDADRCPGLVFRPLRPKIAIRNYLITKKGQVPTPAAARFLSDLLESI